MPVFVTPVDASDSTLPSAASARSSVEFHSRTMTAEAEAPHMLVLPPNQIIDDHRFRTQYLGRRLKGKGSPYSIAERSVPELIPVLGSQPAGDVSHKPGGRLPILSARPAVTLVTLKRAATDSAAW